MDDETLFAAFAARTLPAAEWTHQAHLRIAWMHLARYPDLDEAHLRVRIGIVRLNTAHGLEETPTRGYHETLTRVWLSLVAAARVVEACGDSRSFLARHVGAFDRAAPLAHYSRERIMSVRARSVFVEPDLAPLPF